MPLKNKIVVLVILICELFNVSLANNLFYSKPHILSDREVIIEPNANHTILCQGNKPLEWIIPLLPTDENFNTWTSFSTEEETPMNKQFQYGLRLYITNMSYPFVGFYNCHFNDTEDISEKNIENDKIYLYVNDEEHLAVKDVSINYVYVRRGDTVVIPCRPTSPDVVVKLQTVDSDYGEVPLNILRERDNAIYMYRYNPFYGILTNDTYNEQDILFRCDYRRGDVEKRVMIYLTIETITSYLPTPYIADENKGHTVVGGNIRLNCSLRYTKSSVQFSWITPTGPYNSRKMSHTDTPNDSLLVVYNVTLDDMGLYICNVSDHQDHYHAENISVTIFGKREHYINMTNVDDLYQEAKAGDDYVELIADVWGHPQPNFTWLNNVNQTISLGKGKKYEVNYIQPTFGNAKTTENIRLQIKKIDIKDFGHYTLVGRNEYMEKTLNFFVNVTDKPTVWIETDPFHLLTEEGKVRCIAAGNPIPNFKWEYKPCLRPECNYTSVEGQVTENEGLKITSEIKINATEPGLVKCTASNVVGSEVDVTAYHVTDVPDGFGITGFADTAIVDSKTAIYAIGENVSIKCSAAATNYSHVTWLLGENAILETKRITLNSSSTNYSNSTTLNIDNSNRDDSGIYTCRVFTPSGMEKTKFINLSIQEPVKAEIVDTNMNEEIVEDFPKPVTMYCMVKGLPKPKILWYKDDVIFNPTEPRIYFEKNRQVLVFNETVAEDAGRYKCEAVYKNNHDVRLVKLVFRNAPETIQDWLIYIIVLLLVALGLSMIYLIVRVKKERKLKREMQLLGLANFEKGAVENINPELGIDDQAELLPYDKKWEFPIEQLKLGKQLGSGAFGVVLKGEAKHIIEGEPITTVAVKMVKKNADNTYIKALASELKIMVHLGKHLNVVNLLGACTKNVVKRELLVIVEYCRFGNLQNYLLKHRQHFVNQIDPQNGKVNYLIGQELLDRTYSISSNRSNAHYPMMKYATLAFSDSANNSNVPSPSAMGDYRADPNSDNTDMTALTQGDDSVMLSNNSTQPEWRSNYKGDYKGNVNPISTKDLIAYSFQVARGMEYLASRKVLHGDLAARNILLSEENIVKICDFGLAKSMYKNDNYRKRGDCPLPVKWMAIESIRDRVFSTQSDCWSFGIVLWELFSLGRTPYPGMEANERLYHKLVDGYRLEKPEYCPQELYQMMTECWSVKPAARPTFTKLTEKIGTLLEDTLRRHYIDLNDPYLAMNTKMLEGQSDYLSMLSPPSFDVIVSPNYVNEVKTSPSEDGYMSMKPSTIFSPRLSDDEVFDFNITNRKNLSSDEVKGHELLPMLRIISEADSETPLCSPTGVSNPSYQLPPTILIDDRNGQTEIVKSTDNYVNMPQNKSLIKDKTMNDGKLSSNVDNKKETHNYVNGNNQDWSGIQV